MKDVEIYRYVWCIFMEKIKSFKKNFKRLWCMFMEKIKLFKKLKRPWFELYWIIGFIVVILLLLFKHSEFAIAVFSVIFLTQKQKLEETRLFSELFTGFNKRYDDLNERIATIKSQKPPCQDEIDKILTDYFNLCAEEYLFYKEGRILDSVWGAWCRGMKEHLRNNNIQGYWEKAQKENSYYGLSTVVIENDAKIQD